LKAVTAAAMTLSVLLIIIIIMAYYILIILAVTITVPHKLVTMIRRLSSQSHGIVLGGRISCIRTIQKLVLAKDLILLWKLWEQHLFWDLRKTIQCVVPTQMEISRTTWQMDVLEAMDKSAGARASRRGWILCCVSTECCLYIVDNFRAGASNLRPMKHFSLRNEKDHLLGSLHVLTF
jgi:hypothetical protein